MRARKVAPNLCPDGGARNNRSAHIRWPWMAVMVMIFGVDLSATVTFITDTFRTRVSQELNLLRST